MINRATLVASARARPPEKTYLTLVVAGAPAEWIEGDKLYRIITRHARRRINEDDPSLYGSRLLGHEGTWGQMVVIELRTLSAGGEA